MHFFSGTFPTYVQQLGQQINKKSCNTFDGEVGKISEAWIFGLEVKLLMKRLSIIFPIIFWPIVWLRSRPSGTVGFSDLPDGEGIPTKIIFFNYLQAILDRERIKWLNFLSRNLQFPPNQQDALIHEYPPARLMNGHHHFHFQ